LDLKQIKQLIELMRRSELTEFEVEEQGFKIRIKRDAGGQPAVSSSAPVVAAPAAAPASSENAASAAAKSTAATSAATPADPNADEAGYAYVKSPMVGTFYRSPSPDNPPFVDVNAKVDAKSVVCIIEAMKIMNEIQAEIKGTVVEILAENGQPVEYGQRLFKIKLG
jgi:acetyl-CoA carboxylase biotin carboxyl carrier protein